MKRELTYENGRPRNAAPGPQDAYPPGELAQALLARGALTSDWLPTFAAVPRQAFLPDVVWPDDGVPGRSRAVDRAVAPEEWRRYAESDVPLVTQWDEQGKPGRHPCGGTPAVPGGPLADRTDPRRQATSSASMPSLVLGMLRDLDVRPGHTVLEIGTGTGYNAALLAHRTGGPGHVATMDVDPAVTEAARAALERAGYPVRVVTGDGYEGYPALAPYDRVIATCGLRAIPYTWVEQTRPGGGIVAPWGTHFTADDSVVRLTVHADGTATGTFTRPARFMKLRAQRLPFAGHAARVPRDVTGTGDPGATRIPESLFTGGRFAPVPYVIGLLVPDCFHSVAEKREGTRPVWFYGLTDDSWAVVVFRDGRPRAAVHQYGPRRLWDEVEAACDWWRSQGEPGYGRLGLTVGPQGQYAWLDEPGRAVSAP